jgi:hypothetical protein
MKHPILAFLYGMVFPLSFCTAQNFWQSGSGPAGRTVYALTADRVTGLVFAGTDSGVYRSLGDGSPWTHLVNGLPPHPVVCLGENSKSNLYAGGNDGIFRSTNGGDSWVQLPYVTGNRVTCLAVNDADQVLFGTDSTYDRLWRLDPDGSLHGGGALFTALITSIVVKSNGDIFAGMISNPAGGGVFRSSDDGLTWTPFNAGLPDTPSVSALTSDSSGDLFAGTPSNGVFLSANEGVTWILSSGTGGSIGPSGGSVASNDGKISLHVPPGALNSTVYVTIQPVADSIPSGKGSVYTLSPSGLVFSTPATLTFAYVDSLLSGMPPQLFGVAYKDQAGHWIGVTGGSIDTAAKTISAPITHFSEWGTYESYRVAPQQAVVLIGGTITMSAFMTGPRLASSDSSIPLYPIGIPVQPNQWLVNGIPYGSSTVGTVSQLMGLGNAIYTAPGSMPANNPVAVTAQFILPDLSELDVISNVQILAKDWAFGLTRTNGYQCKGGSLWAFKYVDGANIVFHLGNDFQIASTELPISLIPSLTGVGTCQAGFSVSVTPGNPTRFVSLSGGYNQKTRLFSFTVDFWEADFPGIVLSYGTAVIIQTPISPGTEGKGTFPFPAINGYAIFISDITENLPSYIEYEWLLTTTESAVPPQRVQVRR